jgi:hypothetical protein
LRTSIGRTLVRADRRRKPPSSRSARGPDRAEPNVRFEVRLHAGFPSGRLTSSNVGTWVVPNQDSSVVPQTLQHAKNFVSVRLYSAPQVHWTIVTILRICAYGGTDQAGF